jgi:hypothetical protein
VSATRRSVRRNPNRKGGIKMWVVDLIIERQRSIERAQADRQPQVWYLDIDHLLKNERRRKTMERL